MPAIQGAQIAIGRSQYQTGFDMGSMVPTTCVDDPQV